MDFENEFISDEEDEEEMESLINYIQELPGLNDGDVSVTNPQKAKAIMNTYKILKYITKNSGAKVTCELNEPCNSMGSVTVVGKKLIFDKPELFSVLARVASNVDIYTKTNGDVQIDFTFHNLTIQLN